MDRAQVFLHEKVHSLLSPSASAPLAQLRADLRAFLYGKSSLMRYSEEALAETAAQAGTRAMSGLSAAEALREGLTFPLRNGYVRGEALAAEAVGAAAKTADTAEQTLAALE